MNWNPKKTRFLVTTAILSALGVLLTLIEFPLPFFPPFLAFNVADLPAVLGVFAGGPWMGLAVVLLKNLLFTALRFSSQQLVGMVANILIGTAYVLPVALIARKRSDFRARLLSLALGTVCMALMGMASNLWINIPFYALLMGVDISGILAMTGSAAFGTMAGYLLLAVLPFNLLRGAVMSALALLLYKPLAPFLRR